MRKLLALALVVPFLSCGKPEDPKAMTIVVYSRENNSGTYMYFKEHVLNNEDFAASVQTHPGTGALINAVSKDRRSIGYGGIGYAKGVKALPVKKDATTPAVEPTMTNVVNGSYPISRYLYFYTAGQPEGAVKHFIAWCLGDEGQKICEAVGYYPMPIDKRMKIDAGSKPSGKHTITIKGSDTMVILGQRWAEHYMKENPDVLVQITGGGSGTGIAALIDGATNICQASRPMKQAEKDKLKAKQNKETVEIPVAMDGLAIFVHESNPIAEISLPQLKSIYTGKVKIWGELDGTNK
jgi:ABC-type phosphate transport system substrate-binding protein